MTGVDAGGIAVVRDHLAFGLSQRLAVGGKTFGVGSLADVPDFPGAVLRRASELDLFGQVSGSYCIAEVPFEVLLVVGPVPGADGATALLDYWAAVLASADALGICAEQDGWPEGLAAPVVESIGPEEVIDVFGRDMHGSIVQIIAQVEFNKE